MADNSAIEWTDATWNPVRARNLKTGKLGWHCEHSTTGCEFCYSEGFNKRLGTGLAFKPGHRADIEIFLDDTMLTLPLRWKRPRKIFVCSMTDLFADFVPDEFIDKMFAVMALAPQHTFQVLTKRAARMRNFLIPARAHPVGLEAFGTTLEAHIRDSKSAVGRGTILQGDIIHLKLWPLPNVWLGVSAERQIEADERVRQLLDTPAAFRFVSAEPLLGPLDLTRICILPQRPGSIRAGINLNALLGRYCESGVAYTGDWDVNGPSPPVSERRKLDWVIAGGESGRKARPMHPAWARDLCDQCMSTDVPFFFKQWGEWWLDPHPALSRGSSFHKFEDGTVVERVGKQAAGRLLDGKLHSEFPTRTENLHGV